MLILVILLIPNGVIARLQELHWFRRRKAATSEVPRETHKPTAPSASFDAASQVFVPTPTSDEVVLKVDGIRKAYGGVVAVNNVSFAIKRGQFVGIVGPNGAGKTTMFDLLTGFQRPTSGTIHLGTTDITGQPSHKLARMGLRRTFQVPRPFPGLSIYDNVLLGALAVRHRLGHDLESASWHALESIGLTNRASAVASLSTPSQIRLLEVARAVVSRPQMILLDEPLAGLDPIETNELINILQKLHRTGLTIVIVDHAIGLVAKVVERMIVLDNGSLIADGSPDEVTHAPRVVEAYLGTRWQDA
jgi:ABC-type branched-subunit amino acid transport system ATPase component